jgi:hypothetical protein
MTRGNQRGARIALAFLLGIAGAVLAPAPAAAQIAAALGQPLASPDLDVGTVSVRVVAGSSSAPVVGTEVTILVNGTPRSARTDSAGRAMFAGLPVHATVVANVLDEDKNEHPSEPFTIPEQGGMRVLLTTKPWQGGGGGAPFAGGAGMENPRQLSGNARPERSDPPGTLTVRVTYDDLKDTPEGVEVVLLGYVADGTTTYQAIKTDKAGRAKFSDLDRSGGTSYFAMTVLPRNGAVDRVMSPPVLLESQAGVRMVLSSEKRDSKAPAIDDLGKNDRQVATPAGKVRVVLEGAADASAAITVIDAVTKKVLGQASPTTAPPDPSRVQGGTQFSADSKLAAGTLDIEVIGGPGQTDEPIPGIAIRVIPADNHDAAGGFGATTAADGTVRMMLPPGVPQKAVFTINGRALESKPFELQRSGGKLTIRAHWEDIGRLQALLDIAAAPGQVLYAEAVANKGQHYRSLPFPVLNDTGTKISVYVFPRVMFRFQLQGEAEDDHFAVRGRFEVANYSWMPYRAGPDGLLVPAPKGFKGAVVAETDQGDVSVSQGEGFLITRPVPPGTRVFHAGFVMPVEAGSVAWSLDLPMGSYESEFDVKQSAGMVVHTPPGVQSETKTIPQGTYAVLGPVTIAPMKAMVMSIDGLPSLPAWRTVVPMIVGIAVICVVLVGVYLALTGKRGAAATTRLAQAQSDARRQRLLDQLVEIERDGGSAKRREQLLDELERLWGSD